VQLIAGLGNPGDRYARNRHNVGFMAVDAIAARHGFSPFRQKFSGLLSEGTIGDEKVMLFKPQTFMNRSGPPVAEAAGFYKIPLDKVLIIHDELDLPPGKVRIKAGGSNGGHNGLKSLDQALGLGYRRLRFGIGHPGSRERVNGHVLSDFAKADEAWLNEYLAAIADHVGLLIEGRDPAFLNKLVALARPDSDDEADKAAAGAEPKPASQSHVRQARPTLPAVKVPETGPLAAMLKKLFNKG
jgi:PTH1 family peptidyl-tRNA hydrolase